MIAVLFTLLIPSSGGHLAATVCVSFIVDCKGVLVIGRDKDKGVNLYKLEMLVIEIGLIFLINECGLHWFYQVSQIFTC